MGFVGAEEGCEVESQEWGVRMICQGKLTKERGNGTGEERKTGCRDGEVALRVREEGE